MRIKFTIFFLTCYTITLFLFGFYIQRSQSAEALNVQVLEVTVTAYSPSPQITDNTPFEMASGKKATVRDLQEMKYVALSRDLLKNKELDIAYGDVIYIGFEVQDKMGPKTKNSVDFFVRNLKIAKWIGRTKRKIIILKNIAP